MMLMQPIVDYPPPATIQRLHRATSRSCVTCPSWLRSDDNLDEGECRLDPRASDEACVTSYNHWCSHHPKRQSLMDPESIEYWAFLTLLDSRSLYGKELRDKECQPAAYYAAILLNVDTARAHSMGDLSVPFEMRERKKESPELTWPNLLEELLLEKEGLIKRGAPQPSCSRTQGGLQGGTDASPGEGT